MLLPWRAAFRSPVLNFYDILRYFKRLIWVSSPIHDNAMSTKSGPGFCFAGDSPTMNAHMQNALENKNRVIGFGRAIWNGVLLFPTKKGSGI